jgi:hypothetical protein
MPLLTVIFCDFLECRQYRLVGWILTIKGGVRVGVGIQRQKRKRLMLMRLDGGTFNNQLGAEALMECRGGGREGEMTAAMATKLKGTRSAAGSGTAPLPMTTTMMMTTTATEGKQLR